MPFIFVAEISCKLINAEFCFFGEIMSASEIIGALVIIASCLVIAWRELVRTREVN